MQILEKDVHRGGFGRIDKVMRSDGSVAAMKTFDPTPGRFPAAEIEKLRKRFCREVRIQRSLDSEVFLPVYEHDLNGDHPWFVMPWADKNYLDQIREDKKSGKISSTALADILNGLDALHLLGYVHRDLKPQNVLFHEGHWKLSDFGLTLPPEGSTTKLTSVDSAWGTQEYAAPEQRKNFGTVTAAADIYAFGCLLHDIAGKPGRLPFQRQTCPGPLAPVIEKCTETSPGKRFKSIAGLRSVLLGILAQPLNLQPSLEMEGWTKELAGAADWDVQKLEEFARFVGDQGESTDGRVITMWPIFHSFNEDLCKAFCLLDYDLWLSVGIVYCDWVGRGGFDFAYCDVLAVRMEAIFDGARTIDLKAAALIALARMASGHNRWFAMRRLMGLCGPLLDDQVAARVAIEIQAEEIEVDFRRCANVISKSVQDFHPRIADILIEKVIEVGAKSSAI
ncbi:serine/threonine protein kinase [Myxococcus llanfairpwllgwyngyllgogerychwyrndrobwllllantysiliogogogochensis]|uniref:Serine/threonine protein kinase n=1 Tax=Myxococcus llanfairpwllgwyngyllgogerychwyrndrobwllllantysiliogogogochensis TaxID=2590453 RepID=A0A540WY02_9BACT|nr:serine/threonine-protein kinase [Myxococcus llanfairpwllgwyngyllgogerychwyrndrobwllllantysiliogogogochensis]TQF13889.1 serine/threonine protein kinase [Myxococcus llanfairpwllgwyngyllgogerychwyrndrobwllllantysiliogogogochensis]